jgi:hypothetical protein
VEGSITPISGTLAEIYGSLGRVGLDRPGMLGKVTAQLSTALSKRRATAADDDDKLPAMEIITGGTAPWAWALTAFGLHQKLTPDAINLLRSVAPVAPSKDDVEVAIANQGNDAGRCGGAICTDPLTHSATDSNSRNLEADLLAISIARLSRQRFDEAVAELEKRRKKELEPEARIALGRAIAGARSKRYSSIHANVGTFPQD